MEGGGGFVVAAKVISQHMIWKIVHENDNKEPNVTQVQHFCCGFDHANLARSFCGTKYLQKLDSVMCIFSNMST